MLSKLFSRFKSIFVPMPSPPASPSFEPPKARFLPYLGGLQNTKEFIMHIMYHIESGNDWQALCQNHVVKLEYCKTLAEGDKPEHDFLVATVIDETSTSFRLQIERRIFPTVPLIPDKPEPRFFALLGSGQPSRAKDSANCSAAPLAYIAAKIDAFTSLVSRSTTSIDSTASSFSEASQAVPSPPGPAFDIVWHPRPSDVLPPGVTVLRSYEPLHNSLSLLHLAMIIEAVHDREDVYDVLSSNCYWFAMMIMGICMLQGGHVQVVGKNSGAEDESLEPPSQVFIAPYTLSEREMPEALKPIPVNEDEDDGVINIEVTMPIPTPHKDDIEVITNGAGAGEKTIMIFGRVSIVKAYFEDIWQVGRESLDHYDVIVPYLKNRRSNRELLRQIEEMRIQHVQELEKRDKEIEKLDKEIEKLDKRIEHDKQIAERDKKIEALLQRQVAALSIESTQPVQAGRVSISSHNSSHAHIENLEG